MSLLRLFPDYDDVTLEVAGLYIFYEQNRNSTDALLNAMECNGMHGKKLRVILPDTKDAEIQGLKAKLDATELAQRLAITEALTGVERERDELKAGLERAELEKQLAEQSLKDKYQTQIKDRDDQLERLRDLKARLSTKMVGETLGQYNPTMAAKFAELKNSGPTHAE